MNVILLLLQAYLAVVLGISGLAKAVNPRQFAATLQRQRILPDWSIECISYLVPWLEMVLALLLVVGVLPIVIGIITMLVFMSFLTIEIIVLKTNRHKQCGCYGMAHRQKVDEASVAVSTIFIILASFNVWGTIFWEPVAALWRIPGIIVFGLGSTWLLTRIIHNLVVARRKNMSLTNESSVQLA